MFSWVNEKTQTRAINVKWQNTKKVSEERLLRGKITPCAALRLQEPMDFPDNIWKQRQQSKTSKILQVNSFRPTDLIPNLLWGWNKTFSTSSVSPTHPTQNQTNKKNEINWERKQHPEDSRDKHKGEMKAVLKVWRGEDDGARLTAGLARVWITVKGTAPPTKQSRGIRSCAWSCGEV